MKKLNFTIKELGQFIDVLLNDEEEALLKKYKDTSINSIDNYLREYFN